MRRFVRRPVTLQRLLRGQTFLAHIALKPVIFGVVQSGLVDRVELAQTLEAQSFRVRRPIGRMHFAKVQLHRRRSHTSILTVDAPQIGAWRRTQLQPLRIGRATLSRPCLATVLHMHPQHFAIAYPSAALFANQFRLVVVHFAPVRLDVVDGVKHHAAFHTRLRFCRVAHNVPRQPVFAPKHLAAQRLGTRPLLCGNVEVALVLQQIVVAVKITAAALERRLGRMDFGMSME